MLSKLALLVTLLLALFLLLLVTGCGGSVEPTGTVDTIDMGESTEPSATPEMTVMPVATLEPLDIEAYQDVNLPQADLSFQVPEDWTQRKPELVWSPPDNEGLRMGLSWQDLQPPMEPEAVMLPNHSQVLQSDPVASDWASGRSFMLEVYAPAAQGGGLESVEAHILLVVQRKAGRRAYDLYASAPTAAELAHLTPALWHMFSSATLLRPAATPTPMDVTAYQELVLPEAGLAFEVPEHWTRLDPEIAWGPPDLRDVRVGFAWQDLQPPMEPEAVMLPGNAQILDVQPVSCNWAEGRSVTLEVYAPAQNGSENQASVASVETHILIVVEREGGRRVYDFYASAPTAEALEHASGVLWHLFNSATRLGISQGLVC
jgi:hypothetical protein